MPTGPLAGTTFAPSTGNKTQNLDQQRKPDAGKYYIALTSIALSACAVFNAANGIATTFYGNVGDRALPLAVH